MDIDWYHNMVFTLHEKAHCVVWYATTGSQAVVQRKFRGKFLKHSNGKAHVPDKKTIKEWYDTFMNRGDIHRKKRENTR
jgi:hypothetical protein